MGSWSGRLATDTLALVLATYGDRCHLCGERGATSSDHIIPRSAGGDHSLDNLRPAHTSCNSARGAMPLAKWFELHPIRSSRDRASPSRSWFESDESF